MTPVQLATLAMLHKGLGNRRRNNSVLVSYLTEQTQCYLTEQTQFYLTEQTQCYLIEQTQCYLGIYE